MPPLAITASDFENLRALAGTIQKQHDTLVELIQLLHTIRAHLAGAHGIINGVLDRAEERNRPSIRGPELPAPGATAPGKTIEL